eukprot:jgi/Bigna1/143478/aug1.79_g18186
MTSRRGVQIKETEKKGSSKLETHSSSERSERQQQHKDEGTDKIYSSGATTQGSTTPVAVKKGPRFAGVSKRVLFEQCLEDPTYGKLLGERMEEVGKDNRNFKMLSAHRDTKMGRQQQQLPVSSRNVKPPPPSSSPPANITKKRAGQGSKPLEEQHRQKVTGVKTRARSRGSRQQKKQQQEQLGVASGKPRQRGSRGGQAIRKSNKNNNASTKEQRMKEEKNMKSEYTDTIKEAPLNTGRKKKPNNRNSNSNTGKRSNNAAKNNKKRRAENKGGAIKGRGQAVVN